MGIPSYYKKVCDAVPGLLGKTVDAKVQNLFLDFNCLIYYCIHKPGTSLGEYEGEEKRLEWEKRLITEVCKYTKQIVNYVNPSETVYISIDGVVPMAKMRQQRLRRFKSVWVHKEEVEKCGKPNKPRWDTNAITPGTHFMDTLAKELASLCKKNSASGSGSGSGPKWELSDATQPGEGEQKVFSLFREKGSRNELNGIQVVYGLDADLIVLSLLHNKDTTPIYLFREAMECGEVVRNAFQEEEYRYLSISKLAAYISRNTHGMKKSDFLMNYCMGMTLLGNDFIPHGLSANIKNGGHELLLELLKDMNAKGLSFIVLIDEKPKWSIKGLEYAFFWLGNIRETDYVKKTIETKHVMSCLPVKVQAGKEQWEYEAAKWNRQPLERFEENCLIESASGHFKDYSVRLYEDWRDIYNRRFLSAESSADVKKVCREFCNGLQWVLEYYTGKSAINPEWMYSWMFPPTWNDLLSYIQNEFSEEIALPSLENPDSIQYVKPQEQLALVLPLESYWLIRDKGLKNLPTKAPQLWVNTFKVVSAGRKFMWECEASIPLFTPKRLRFLLKSDS